MDGRLTIKLFVVICGLFAGICGCTAYRQLQQERSQVYDDLTAICDAIPTPEGLEKTGSQNVIKPEGGVVTNNFETELPCELAKQPLYQYMISNGYQPTNQQLGYYYRENYLFHVTCRRRSPQRNKIQVSCAWDKSGTDKDAY